MIMLADMKSHSCHLSGQLLQNQSSSEAAAFWVQGVWLRLHVFHSLKGSLSHCNCQGPWHPAKKRPWWHTLEHIQMLVMSSVCMCPFANVTSSISLMHDQAVHIYSLPTPSNSSPIRDHPTENVVSVTEMRFCPFLHLFTLLRKIAPCSRSLKQCNFWG